MKNTVLWAAFFFMLALLFSAGFASVEGSIPYAGNLPDVWRPDPNLWWVKILYWFPNLGRPVNGLDTFFLLLAGGFGIFLVPVYMKTHGHPYGLKDWFEMLTVFIVFSVIEDWVWYLINPFFGIQRFWPEYIPNWMHPLWFMGLPSQYWYGLFASIPVALIAHWPDYKSGAKFWLVVWATMIVLSLIVAAIAELCWIR
jgi:hypothetical protein